MFSPRVNENPNPRVAQNRAETDRHWVTVNQATVEHRHHMRLRTNDRIRQYGRQVEAMENRDMGRHDERRQMVARERQMEARENRTMGRHDEPRRMEARENRAMGRHDKPTR